MISIGLYRHFKGDYYFVKELAKDCGTDEVFVVYFNVCHPEYGTFIRPLSDFTAEYEDDGRVIFERPDNTTGQHKRFERIKELSYQLSSISTQTLINELKWREDSPLQDVNVEELNSLVAYSDYIIGVEHSGDPFREIPYGVSTEATFETLEGALKYFHTHKHRRDTHVFRRVFVREKE